VWKQFSETYVRKQQLTKEWGRQKMSAPKETNSYIPQVRISLTPDWFLSWLSYILTCLNHFFLHNFRSSIRRPKIWHVLPELWTVSNGPQIINNQTVRANVWCEARPNVFSHARLHDTWSSTKQELNRVSLPSACVFWSVSECVWGYTLNSFNNDNSWRPHHLDIS
jgi:hypothetical protein